MATIYVTLTSGAERAAWRDGTLLLKGSARLIADAIVASPTAEPAGWATLPQAWALLRVIYPQAQLRTDELP